MSVLTLSHPSLPNLSESHLGSISSNFWESLVDAQHIWWGARTRSLPPLPKEAYSLYGLKRVETQAPKMSLSAFLKTRDISLLSKGLSRFAKEKKPSSLKEYQTYLKMFEAFSRVFPRTDLQEIKLNLAKKAYKEHKFELFSSFYKFFGLDPSLLVRAVQVGDLDILKALLDQETPSPRTLKRLWIEAVRYGHHEMKRELERRNPFQAQRTRSVLDDLLLSFQQLRASTPQRNVEPTGRAVSSLFNRALDVVCEHEHIETEDILKFLEGFEATSLDDYFKVVEIVLRLDRADRLEGIKDEIIDSLLWHVFYIDSARFIEVFRRLLPAGRPLVWASDKGYLEVVSFLIENDPISDEDRGRAFILAAARGHLEIVRFFLEKGSISQWDRRIAFVGGAQNGRLEIVRFFLANEPLSDEDRGWAVQEAAVNGHLEVVSCLVNVPIPDENRGRAFVAGAANGHLEMVRFLLENGPISERDRDKASRVAAENGHLEIVQFLSEKGSIS